MKDKQHVYEAEVYLNDLDPEAVRQEMKCVHQPAEEKSGSTVYSTSVSAARPPANYTARVE